MVHLEKITYSENRRRPERAQSYDTKYEREMHKRISNRRELRILRELLGLVGRQDRVLDVPCGAGRLSGVIAEHAERLYEADYSFEMLRLCRANAAPHVPYVVNASAFQLPFPDAAFDLVVSIRLSHHIPDPQARRDHLREILRASRRHVLFTYFDEESLKNRLRNLYRKLGGKKRAKLTLTRDEVARIARAAGFRVVASRSISSVFSGHSFTLMTRQ